MEQELVKDDLWRANSWLICLSNYKSRQARENLELGFQLLIVERELIQVFDPSSRNLLYSFAPGELKDAYYTDGLVMRFCISQMTEFVFVVLAVRDLSEIILSLSLHKACTCINSPRSSALQILKTMNFSANCLTRISYLKVSVLPDFIHFQEENLELCLGMFHRQFVFLRRLNDTSNLEVLKEFDYKTISRIHVADDGMVVIGLDLTTLVKFQYKHKDPIKWQQTNGILLARARYFSIENGIS